jgi:hypothetical protein
MRYDLFHKEDSTARNYYEMCHTQTMLRVVRLLSCFCITFFPLSGINAYLNSIDQHTDVLP